jgi:hypothetical protein
MNLASGWQRKILFCCCFHVHSIMALSTASAAAAAAAVTRKNIVVIGGGIQGVMLSIFKRLVLSPTDCGGATDAVAVGAFEASIARAETTTMLQRIHMF